MPALYTYSTLSLASGYTGIHGKQVYDELALRLSVNASWSLVDTFTFVSGANTFTYYIWKCAATGSGLPSDFFIAFRTEQVTATGVFTTTTGPRAWLFEAYNTSTRVASKPAPIAEATNVVIAADNTHPATWAMTTTAMPTTNWAYIAIPMYALSTSAKVQALVDDDMFTFAITPNPNTSAFAFYIGRFETLLSAADDPMPIVIGTNSSSGGQIAYGFSATRHPKFVGTYGSCFGLAVNVNHQSTGTPNSFGFTPWAFSSSNAAYGALGDPTNTANGLYLGPIVSRIPLSTAGPGQTSASRGGIRGSLKHWRAVATAAHGPGDTFVVDGKTYAGIGVVTGGIIPVLP